MEKFVLLNKEDLRSLIAEMIFAGKPESETPEVAKNFLSFEEGLAYINRRFRISESTLYKKTSRREIPFKRFGERKIVFEPQELDQWIVEQISGKSIKVAEIVSQSARRKAGL